METTVLRSLWQRTADIAGVAPGSLLRSQLRRTRSALGCVRASSPPRSPSRQRESYSSHRFSTCKRRTTVVALPRSTSGRRRFSSALQRSTSARSGRRPRATSDLLVSSATLHVFSCAQPGPQRAPRATRNDPLETRTLLGTAGPSVNGRHVSMPRPRLRSCHSCATNSGVLTDSSSAQRRS